MILRLLALQLGLYDTAIQPKRAIQFGSRIAKLENKKGIFFSFDIERKRKVNLA